MDAAIVYSVSGFATNDKAEEIEGFFKNEDGTPKLPQSNRKCSRPLRASRPAPFLTRILAEDLSAVL